MPGIPSDQVLAIMRLRQWAFERAKLRNGDTTRFARNGWRERRQRQCDARNVRVLDFERALSHLNPEQQQVLVLAYNDKARHQDIAAVLGCSPRKVTYLLPIARRPFTGS